MLSAADFPPRPPCPQSLWLGALLAASLIGCSKEPEIRSYTVPRDPASSAGVPSEGVPTRMLAAIVLRNGQAWFFKATGPEASLDNVADDVRAFVQSLELPAEEPEKIAWKVPDGWTEGAPRPMREATLQIPAEGGPVELAISKLGYEGDDEPYLLANINRWRGQLGLAPVEELNEGAGVTKLELPAAWWFDAVGEMNAGAMTPPFAAGPAAPQARSSEAAAPPERATPAEPLVDFELPAGWTEQPPRPMVSQVLALGEGDEAVRIELSQFPAGAPMIADPLSNVNRWRGQVGAAPIQEQELDESTEAVEIAGAPGLVAEVVSDDASQAILAAWTTKSDQVWFFKMIGSKAGTDAHRDEFLKWLQTVNITAPTDGESNGDS